MVRGDWNRLPLAGFTTVVICIVGSWGWCRLIVDKASNVANRISINISTYFNQSFDILHPIVSWSCPDISLGCCLLQLIWHFCAGKIKISRIFFHKSMSSWLKWDQIPYSKLPGSGMGGVYPELQLHQWQYDCSWDLICFAEDFFWDGPILSHWKTSSLEGMLTS